MVAVEALKVHRHGGGPGGGGGGFDEISPAMLGGPGGGAGFGSSPDLGGGPGGGAGFESPPGETMLGLALGGGPPRG